MKYKVRRTGLERDWTKQRRARAIEITLSNGDEYRLRELEDGSLDINGDKAFHIVPQATNSIQLKFN